MYFIWYIIIGIIAGFVAGKLVRGGGFGLFINLLVGIVGGVLGGWVFSFVWYCSNWYYLAVLLPLLWELYYCCGLFSLLKRSDIFLNYKSKKKNRPDDTLAGGRFLTKQIKKYKYIN